MANICEFSMQVNGEHKNIEKFYEALTQKNDIWMWRGAEADIAYEDEAKRAFIDGYCKWSICAALIKNALSMKEQKETGERYWSGIDDVKEFLTLFEACKKYHVNMEVFSEELGERFQEHYKYENGT